MWQIVLAFIEKMNFIIDKWFYNPDNKCNCEKKSVVSHILYKNPVWLCETIQSIRLEPLRNFWKMHTRPTCYTKGSLHNACDDVIICTCTSSKPGILLQLHRPSTSQWLECLEFVEILKLPLRHRYVCLSRKFNISHNLSPTLVSLLLIVTHFSMAS